jgi:Ig-like protein
MLHWWFEQNKENVEKYIAKKGITKEGKPELYEMYNPYYTRGLPDKDENIKSSIANEFRTKCGNSPQGSYIRNGLKWYLFGLQGFAKKPNYSPELFKDIFDVEEENNPIYVKGIYTKKEFEDVLKEALAPNSKKAIGINLHGDATYGHAITLWGAAFDEEENVIAIYVCDNNFKPNRIFTYGIYYQQDIYTDYKNDVQVLPYLINYSINFYDKKKHVGEITTLDKGDAQWKKWFDANQ